jgi:hypothetical protein
MCAFGTGIAVVLNIVHFLIDLAGVVGEAVANIPVSSMAIAPLSAPLMLLRPWISVAVTLSNDP